MARPIESSGRARIARFLSIGVVVVAGAAMLTPIALSSTSGSAGPRHPGAGALSHTEPRLPGEPQVGAQFHAMWTSYSNRDRIRILDELAGAGVEWVRIDMGWENFELHRPGQIEASYRKVADLAVDQARARGIKVLATLWLSPRWANGTKNERVPPKDPQDYARFARWAARHFRGRVDAWEVWNEPNLSESFGGDAEAYAELLKAAYPAFKQGDPSAKVVIGAPAYNDTDWLSVLYSDGIKGSFDVMATHPYQGFSDAPPEAPDDGTRGTLAHIAAVRALMTAHDDADKQVWFTEFGWSSHRTEDGAENWQRGVSDAQQADYFVRTLRWVATNAPYVTTVFWYTDRNQASGNVHLDNFGLLTHDLDEKPVFETLRDYLRG